MLNPFTGSYSHPSSTATMKFAEANQNFYFTTSTGVQKLDALTNTPVAAGAPAALNVGIIANGVSGFLAASTSVAYRVLWGFRDANSNLIQGSPSQRASIDNPAGSSVNTNVTFPIPAGITVNNFFQIYRSDQIAYTGTTPNIPNDNMQLVYEGNPTAGQITALSVTVVDLTPDSLRGAALYTNATQQGILQQNDVPPFASDIASFKNCLFYFNTSTVQNSTFTILSVAGTSGIASTDTLTIGANTFTAITTTPVAGSNNYQLYTAGSPSQNVNTTAINLVNTINTSTTNPTIYAFYLSGATDLPGKILVRNRTLGAAVFNITVSAHGTAFSPNLPTSGTTIASTNTANLNGVMYSKQQIPEAVPAQNIYLPGSANKKILRGLALRDSLFLLKEDGVFRITGSSPANFQVDTLDNTVYLTAPDSAVALNNSVYCVTTQGVVTVTDTGVSVISRPIESELNSIIGTVGATNFAKYCFGIAYESEREYILFVPQTSTDTSATLAYVYNYFTKTWVTKGRSQLAGYVLFSDNRLYLAGATTSNVSKERKDYAYTDYTDESYAISISSFSLNVLTLADASLVAVGDIIYQSNAVASTVTAVSIGTNKVTVQNALTWALGSTQLLKAIVCTVQWVPTTGQNPGMLKQYSEAALLFKSSPFISASMSYLSDISSSFQSVPLTGYSPQGWGLFPWGKSLWGGVVRPQTIRHYIPRDKQRCSLLTPKFICQNGWSNFLLEGLSLQWRPISSRTMH